MDVPVKCPVFPYLVLFLFSLVHLCNYHSVHLCLLIISFAPQFVCLYKPSVSKVSLSCLTSFIVVVFSLVFLCGFIKDSVHLIFGLLRTPLSSLLQHPVTLILCRCCQNCSDVSRHGLHKTSEHVLWFLVPRH